MRTGVIISGIGHVGLILWLLFGGYLTARNDAPAIQVSDVSLITSKQLAQMTAAAAPPPAAPQTKVKTPKPAVETSPAKAPKPEAPPKAAAKPAPKPVPRPKPQPDKLPQVAAETPVQGPKFVMAPTPPKPPEGATPAPDVHVAPPPKASERVAPTPAPAPAPDAKLAAVPQPEVAPAKSAQAAKPQKPKQAAAPKEASTQIVPEASKTAKALTGLSTAPKVSPRPPPRPPMQVASAETAKPKPAKPKKPDTGNKAVDAAVAAALAATSGQGVTAGGQGASKHLGPPLSSRDTAGLLSTLRSTWIVDPGSPSANVTVTVGFKLSPDGKVIAGSIRQVSAQGGDATAQSIAFRKARIAILHGSDVGFDLPPAKYQQWRDIEMVFDPKGMRLQ